MTQEEKLEEAKRLYETANADQKYVLESLFPELKESGDEKMMNHLHSWMKEFGGAEDYTEKVYQWIKGLLDKQGKQKPAWSEEDEDNLNSAIYYIRREPYREYVVEPIVDWLKTKLKSLRPQNSWKPSVAQLNALSIVSKGNAPDDIEAIVSLYQDLKKLMEK